MTAIAPWLSVADAGAAVAFYRRAFSAVLEQQMEAGGVVQVARLSIDGARFWVQQDDDLRAGPEGPLGAGTVRMILEVDDPDAAYGVAVASGAAEVVEVASVHDEHGWRTGRLADPFGLHWELARESGSAGGSHPAS